MKRPRIQIALLTAFFAFATVLASGVQPAYAMSLQEEIELGRKLDAEVQKEYRLSTDEDAIRELNEIGNKLVQNVNRPQIEYHFRILDSDELNAFAIPGGYIYFTDRLWNVLRPDERIGVLAHEIVHVDGRHAIDAISKARTRQLWLSAILAVLGANRTVADITGILHNLYTLKYSRGDERTADTLGLQLVQKAGYNPAGLLLAMRKINRFHDEAGGEPPKIFSSHPPTEERLEYMEQMLREMNVPIPPENVGEVDRKDQIGEVVSADGDRVRFTSNKPLQEGDIVWLMDTGWDYRYENKTKVPVARGVVVDGGTNPTARIKLLNPNEKVNYHSEITVHQPKPPKPVNGIATLERSVNDKRARLVADMKLTRLERLLAVHQVWNEKQDTLTYDNVGYVVVTNPADPYGYVAIQRQKYSYAALDSGAELVKVKDPDQKRWVGPIVSIGRGGQTIEVKPNRQLSKDKIYELAYPPVDPKEKYERRVVGTARFEYAGEKVVLKMTSYTPGWDISGVQNGFDIYEAK